MLQVLYDHEFSFEIKVQWDGGFNWFLGWDPGFDEKDRGNTQTAIEAIQQLFSAAVRWCALNGHEETRASLLESLTEIE